MSTAVAVREQGTGALAMWNDEQVEIIKRLICPDATDTELALFGQVCQRTGLDPFAKQIYGIKRQGRLTIQTGIDGFRLTAQRSREYAGQEGPQWCGEDGVWRDVWLAKEHPSAARVGVYRKGWTRPVWGIATWTEYAQHYQGKPQGQWSTQPSNMLAKCAEAQALRKAFPAELSGLYGKEEMDQADNDGPPPVLSEAQNEAIEIIPPVSSGWTQDVQDRWATGIRAANASGAEIPDKPPAGASRAEIVKALRQLGDNIVAAQTTKARAKLEATLRDVVNAAIAAGVDSFAVPEFLDELSDDEIIEMTVAAQHAIPTEDAA